MKRQYVVGDNANALKLMTTHFYFSRYGFSFILVGKGKRQKRNERFVAAFV